MTTYLNWKVTRFISLHCPRKRMSCIGLFKRNVLTFKQTSRLFYILCFGSFFGAAMQMLFVIEQDSFSQNSRFWMWNIKEVIFNDGYFLCLPFCLDIPPDSTNTKKKIGFFVTSPTFEPRRLAWQDNKQPKTNSNVLLAPESSTQDFNFSMSSVPDFDRKQSKHHTLSLSVPKDPIEYPNKDYQCTLYCKNHGILSRVNLKK